MPLRNYQQDIVNQTIATNLSTLIQIPTGGGKTIIAKEIIKYYKSRGKQVLFVAPQTVLIDQTKTEFRELLPEVINNNPNYNRKAFVLISTLQTAVRRTDIHPDIIIIDEVHYGYSGVMIDSLKFAHKYSRIIGLSATPYDKDGKLLKGFDVVLDKYDIKYMLDNLYLIPVIPVIPSETTFHIDFSRLRETKGDYLEEDLNKLMGDPTAIQEVVSVSKEYIKKCQKAIVFAVNINHAKLLSRAYVQAGFNAEVLHSDMDDYSKEEVIKRFKKGYVKILVSVQMITTGFDVPETDLAVIARPTKSQNLYKQMVGRIMRRSDETGKSKAIMIDCGAVVKNLGKPTAPINERLKRESNSKHTCSFCHSDKLYLIKNGGHAYWQCSRCGSKKEVKEAQIFKCKFCAKEYGKDAKLTISDSEIVLNCDCGRETVISKAINKNLMQNFFDSETTEWLIKRLVYQYQELIVQFYGREALESKEIQDHIKLLNVNIKENPEDFLDLDLSEYITSTVKLLPLKTTSLSHLNFELMKEKIDEYGNIIEKPKVSSAFLSELVGIYKGVQYEDFDSVHQQIKNILNQYTRNKGFSKAKIQKMSQINDILFILLNSHAWFQSFAHLKFENIENIAYIFNQLSENIKAERLLHIDGKSISPKTIVKKIRQRLSHVYGNCLEKINDFRKAEAFAKGIPFVEITNFFEEVDNAVVMYNREIEYVISEIAERHSLKLPNSSAVKISYVKKIPPYSVGR